jgi:NADPH-dependent 2,4-dienoyl-CoA reductase/sulfur reductase-like enzyme
VLERGPYVSFANCGLPYHIGGVIADRQQLLLQTPASLKAMLNLDVRTGHEAVSIARDRKIIAVRELAADRVYELTYDKLVLCPGAQPLRPPLPGAGASRDHGAAQCAGHGCHQKGGGRGGRVAPWSSAAATSVWKWRRACVSAG